MRYLGLTLLLTLATVSGARAGEPVRDGERITGTVHQRPGATLVEIRDDSAIPFDRPIFRLVALPPGAADPEVRPVDGAAGPVEVEVGDPMILRGVPVVPVRLSPRSAAPESPSGPASRSVEIELLHRASGASGPAPPAALRSRGFFASFGDVLLGAPSAALASEDEGGYLVVTAPEFRDGLEPFVAWKRETGLEVTVVTTDDTGTTNEAIRDYIAAFYAAAANPPQFVLLVGDVEQLPGFDYHGSVSDLPYAAIDGDDFLPDVEIGRFSVQNAFQLETVLAKSLRYEQDPDRAGGDEWFARGLMVGGNYASSTPVPTSRWCREQLLHPDVGFAAVDSVYYPPIDAVGPYYIRPIIDAGVSIVSYRGWAYGIDGWDAPQFTTGDIGGLANGWKLPVVFSFVCLNGDFASPECFGEGWVRAGTAADPKGAVAFLGNSEHWSHTRYNDSAAIGAFDAIRGAGVRRLGAILNAAKGQILEQFPDQMDYDPWTDESVEFYYYIYSLLGDPGMEVWMGAPRTITVAHADSLASGSTSLEVEVTGADGVTPVPDARVGVCQGDVVLGCARTDAEGKARVLSLYFPGSTDSVKVTVTGTGLLPYRGSAVVVSGGPYLSLDGWLIDDDTEGGSSGNGNHALSPGETIELLIHAHNRGASPVVGAVGLLEAIEGATVHVGSVSLPDLLPDSVGTSTDSFVVSVPADAPDGLVTRYRLALVAAGDTSRAGFDVTVVAPALRHLSHAFAGDGVLDPGEATELSVTLLNEGSVRSTTATAVLRTASPELVTVVDSLATFAPAGKGLPAVPLDSFGVVATDSAAIGQAAVFTLTTTDGWGAIGTTGFSASIGEVDHRAPLGPDGYGYYAYDNSDTDYPDAVPVYDWVPISPTYGGTGTALGLGDGDHAVVDLPFPFVFYGRSYDRLMVSDNGWASFEIAPYYDFYNWSLPNTYGAGALLAPFWDNLDPEKEHEGALVGDGIYTFDDAANDRFVVEWSRIGNLRSQHQDENRPDWDELQTFQLILFDPVVHPTDTGDGIVRFQYKQIVNNDDERMYSTVGIENESEDVGLQYTYTNLYPAAAAPLSSGLAIDFTTTPPRYRPFRLASFRAEPVAGGVRLVWTPGDDRPRRGTRVYRRDAAGNWNLARGGALGPDAREFVDVAADPDAPGAYRIGSVDAVGRESLFGPFAYSGAPTPEIRFALERAGANPCRGEVPLRLSLPARGVARLRVYSVTGQRVRTLLHGPLEAGSTDLIWDGRDDRGVAVASGVYFVELGADSGRRGIKVTLLR